MASIQNQEVFGSDSDSSSASEDDIEAPVIKRKNILSDDDESVSGEEEVGKQEESSNIHKTILGSDLSDSSKSNTDLEGNDLDEENLNYNSDDNENDTETNVEQQNETKINVDFSLIKADLGNEIHLVKMPNFLSVETRPFDPALYDDEPDKAEIVDEEGRTRLKLKVENTIRWRPKYPNVKNFENVSADDYESNARMVRWSDGSLSLYLGSEIFDIHTVDIQSDFNHLFIREGSGLQGQTVFKDKLTFRPHSTDSFTHRRITKSLVDKTTKSHQVKILPVVGNDPESNRNALIKKEEEKLRASVRRETQQRRMREKQMATAATRYGSRMSGSYADDVEDDPNTLSVSAVKHGAKKGRHSNVYSDSESLSDISDGPVSKTRKVYLSNDDSD